jgi:5-formaminoimidazole-4-carboxamide-1-beta-D-ribofuranosyl 5'-monophosphate synthetase
MNQGLKSYLFCNHLAEAEINEDGLSEVRAKHYVFGFDVEVDYFKRMHHSETLLERCYMFLSVMMDRDACLHAEHD